MFTNTLFCVLLGKCTTCTFYRKKIIIYSYITFTGNIYYGVVHIVWEESFLNSSIKETNIYTVYMYIYNV